jgi:cytochrome c-type biogenesis protein CcmE
METTMDEQVSSGGRMKFILGGLLILAAVIYLIVTATSATAQYFYTIDEIITRGDVIIGQSIRVSGAVDGDTVEYDPETLTLKFTVAHVPGDIDEVDDQGGLAKVLHDAVSDPTRTRIPVVYVGPKPDLLRHEAQAIMTGQMGNDGIFYADELLLKCPTRYEEYEGEG